jgi:hypothetical protein
VGALDHRLEGRQKRLHHVRVGDRCVVGEAVLAVGVCQALSIRVGGSALARKIGLQVVCASEHPHRQSGRPAERGRGRGRGRGGGGARAAAVSLTCREVLGDVAHEQGAVRAVGVLHAAHVGGAHLTRERGVCATQKFRNVGKYQPDAADTPIVSGAGRSTAKQGEISVCSHYEGATAGTPSP